MTYGMTINPSISPLFSPQEKVIEGAKRMRAPTPPSFSCTPAS